MPLPRFTLQVIRQLVLSFGCALSLDLAVMVQVASGQTSPEAASPSASNSFEALDLPLTAEVALDRIQRNDVGTGIVDATYYIEVSAHADPKRVIPVLEAYFDRSRGEDLQNEIASVLISIGDPDPRYWNLILAQARVALASDTPDPLEDRSDPSIGSSEPCSGSAFLSWAKANNLSPLDGCRQAIDDVPEKLLPLAHTGDPRAIPVLQEALKSRNSLIQSIAVSGLVLTQDRDSFPLILAVIQLAPPSQARNLADGLIESNDPRADAVVYHYFPDIHLAEAKRFRAENSQWRRPLLTRR